MACAAVIQVTDRWQSGVKGGTNIDPDGSRLFLELRYWTARDEAAKSVPHFGFASALQNHDQAAGAVRALHENLFNVGSAA